MARDESVVTLLSLLVLAANVSDPAGGRQLLESLQGPFSRLRHLFIDGGYKRSFQEWVEGTLGWTIEVVQHAYAGIRGFWLPEGQELTPEQHAMLKGHRSFTVLPRRGSLNALSPSFAVIDVTAKTMSTYPPFIYATEVTSNAS